GSPSTRSSSSPSLRASSSLSPAGNGISATSIRFAPTAQSSLPCRTATARYGGSTWRSTASASGERSASPVSSSTSTSPFGIVVNSARSPASAGALTVTAASHSFGLTPEPSGTPTMARSDFGGSSTGGGGGSPSTWAGSSPASRRS